MYMLVYSDNGLAVNYVKYLTLGYFGYFSFIPLIQPRLGNENEAIQFRPQCL